jgi:hypothetical protein
MELKGEEQKLLWKRPKVCPDSSILSLPHTHTHTHTHFLQSLEEEHMSSGNKCPNEDTFEDK